jgi:type IV pilus secretin PilQ/predicted competence protein
MKNHINQNKKRLIKQKRWQMNKNNPGRIILLSLILILCLIPCWGEDNLADITYRISQLYYNLGDYSAALTYLYKLERIDPDYKPGERDLMIISCFEKTDKKVSEDYEIKTKTSFEISKSTNSKLDKIIKKIEYKDIEIQHILRALAVQYGLNIITSKDVHGKISIQFSNIKVRDALDAIITINGFVWFEQGNLIKVTSREAVKKEKTTKIFTIHNADAEKLKSILQKKLSKEGDIQADPRSNSLIVTDVATVFAEMEKVIKSLDSEIQQVSIEARIVETTLDKDKDLGIDWNLAAQATGAVRPWNFPFNDNAWRSHVPGYDPPPGYVAGDIETETELLGHVFTFGTLNFSQLRAAFEILYSRGNVKILSKPTIVTLDNQEAKIMVGTNIPIPTYERNETSGIFEITGYEDEKVGITLKVTPHVINKRYIRMKITPQISDVIGYTGPNNERPVTATREANTEVRIKDGHTVVIGGLISNKESKIVKQVPVLGHIPILNFFFKKEDTSADKTELLIFITGRIMTDELAKKMVEEGNKRIEEEKKERSGK